MKQIIRTLLVGGIAGFAGAFMFSYLQKPIEQHEEIVRPAAHFVGYEDRIFGTASNLDFVKSAEMSTPTVVYIKTSAGREQQSYSFLDLLFNNDLRSRKVIGSGSGVVFSKDGYIVTNNHVIEEAAQIEVIHNKRTYKAKIIGTDPSTDLALLKIEAKNLQAIRLARSSDVKVGDWVLAVGNPFNLTSTVTAGIISAKGRNINILEGQFPIESFIQTDAAINPGNSGGALVNLSGDLVGINTAILSRTGSYTGYGFAIPSDIVAKVITDLKEYGQVQKAFLGAEVSDIDEETFTDLQLEDGAGVVVTYIESDGAAEKTGLTKGDIILKINGMLVDSKSMFDEQLSYYKPGDKISVEYKRKGKVKQKEILLTNIEGTTEVVKRQIFKANTLGADLEVVPKIERNKLKITNGIRILKISGGLINRLQIEEGFIITAVNNRPIETPEELVAILEKFQGRLIIKGINRRGEIEHLSYYL